MKSLVWALIIALGFQGVSRSAFAQSSRVQETLNQADQSLNEQIREKRQQVAEAEVAVAELQAQLGVARGSRDSSGAFKIKKIFLVTAVASAAALVYGLATTRLEGNYFPMPIPGRGTFIGLFGLVASGVGYMATDATDITLSSSEDSKLSSDLEQARLELNALKRALARLEAKARQ